MSRPTSRRSRRLTTLAIASMASPGCAGAHLIGLSGGDDFAPDRDRSPYPGLAYFEERDASVFFGRSPEVAAALQALQRFDTIGDGGFLLIAGASGSGKSSLLRAGLLPRLKKTQPGRWLLLATLQPRHGFSPLVDLRAALGCGLPAVRKSSRGSRRSVMSGARRPPTRYSSSTSSNSCSSITRRRTRRSS